MGNCAIARGCGGDTQKRHLWRIALTCSGFIEADRVFQVSGNVAGGRADSIQQTVPRGSRIHAAVAALNHERSLRPSVNPGIAA